MSLVKIVKIIWYRWLISVEHAKIDIAAEKYFSEQISYKHYKQLKDEHIKHILVYERVIGNLKL